MHISSSESVSPEKGLTFFLPQKIEGVCKMEGTQKNKMAEAPMKKLLFKMGLPMIISMVLQALYNVIDSIFVANMGELQTKHWH